MLSPPPAASESGLAGATVIASLVQDIGVVVVVVDWAVVVNENVETQVFAQDSPYVDLAVTGLGVAHHFQNSAAV